LLTPRIAPWLDDAGRNFVKANNKLHCERNHREDKNQPLLRSQRRRLNVGHRRNEYSENEQNHTSDKRDR
jgi:hypothetical protein